MPITMVDKLDIPFVGANYMLMDRHRDTFLVVEGVRGSAKTISILLHIIQRARQNPGTHWLICRSTRTLLADSVLRSLEEQCLGVFGIKKPNVDRAHIDSYAVGNGSFLIPRGLDDVSRNQSAEYAGIYLAEATEMPNREFVESLSASMREKCNTYKQMVLDCNPSHPQHWLNRAAEPVNDSYRRIESYEDYQRTFMRNAEPAKGGWKRLITHWADNVAYFSVNPWGLTDEGREYVEKNLANLTGHMKKRWYYGIWAAESGSVFGEYDPDVHIVDDFEPPESWPQYVGYDEGFLHPSAILWFCESPDGGIYIYDEIWRGGCTVEKNIEEVARRNRDNQRNVLRYYADPMRCFSNTSVGSVFQSAKKCGVTLVPWPRTKTQEVDGRINIIRQYLLNATKKPRERPYIKICRRCVGLQENLASWAYKRNRGTGDLKGDGQFEDRNNDCTDVLLGICSTGVFGKVRKSA